MNDVLEPAFKALDTLLLYVNHGVELSGVPPGLLTIFLSAMVLTLVISAAHLAVNIKETRRKTKCGKR